MGGLMDPASGRNRIICEMAQPQHSPDDLGKISGLPVSLELEDRAGRPVGQFADDCEFTQAAQLLGAVLEAIKQAVNDSADRYGFKRLRVNQVGLHSVPA